MATTFKRCGPDVGHLAEEIISKFDTHAPLAANKVKIDFVFAYGDRDETTGDLISDALKKNGVKALGIARKISLKDRALGRGDAEIALDGDWWGENDEPEREALLDHELHHLVATADRDDLGRPIIKLRKHDAEFGWFRIIAQRHGAHSQERIQARQLMESSGQCFWPEIVRTQTTSRTQKLELEKA